MPKQHAAILAEIIPAEAAVTGSDSSKPAARREKLQKILKFVSRVQQRELQLRIVPYNVMSDGEFVTATANLEALPWILLDLRGRLQPFLLRIGVGIGELHGQFRQPAKNLTGQCVWLAHEALDSLRVEQLLASESRGSRISEREDARGNSRAGDLMRARLPLTRYRTMNIDFDATVNEICKLQDSLIHKMHRSEWGAFVPKRPLGKTGISLGTVGRAEAFGLRRGRLRGLDRLDELRAPERAQAFRRAYFAQLMAAAAGLQHLITERFLIHSS